MNAVASLSRASSAVLDLLYPPRCALCGCGGAWLCADCEGTLPRADGARCPRCWLPVRGNECEACGRRPPVLSSLRAGFRYEEGARGLVHAFKFGGQSVLAARMGSLAAESFHDDFRAVDLVVPVPLHRARRRQRGYDQALRLARSAAKALDLPVVEALRRLRATAAQAGTVSAEDRRRNVEGAFGLRDAALVSGRSVLLIDDVATTGATLDACARPLFAAGAVEVRALTFARED